MKSSAPAKFDNRSRPIWAFRFVALFLSFVSILLAQDAQPSSGPRLKLKVLLIGNQKYQPLSQVRTARNDVLAIESALKDIGVTSTVLIDLPHEEDQLKQIDDFTSSVESSDTVLFYYTGHGTWEVEEDYLLPLDYDPNLNQDELPTNAYGISRLLDRLKKASARIVILDASRALPGPRLSSGFIRLPSDDARTAILFSAAPKETSLPEREGMRNSLFAEAFVAALKKPGLTLPVFLDSVSNSVITATNGRQKPDSELFIGLETFRFTEPPKVAQLHPSSQVNPIDKQEYVWIPEGQFMMGCVPQDHHCEPNENSRHLVRLSKGFWMGKTEVTVTAYLDRYARQVEKVKRPTAPTENKGWNGDRPMVEVTWHDAAGFCKWVGGRLPTEAEWEYAARATTTTRYPWGDEITKDLAKYNQTLKTRDKKRSPYEAFAAVGAYEPNAWGLVDVVGNVWEWCYDWYQDRYDPSTVDDPKGPLAGTRKVLRGGSFESSAKGVRLSSRESLKPTEHYSQDGFRCVIDNWPK